MRILKERELEELLKEAGYNNYYLEDASDPDSYVFDSTKTVDIATDLGIELEVVNGNELIFQIPEGTVITLSELIDKLLIEVKEEYLDNAINFLMSVKQEDASMEELECIYKNASPDMTFAAVIDQAISNQDIHLIKDILFFIKEIVSVHINLFNYYFNRGDIYYCDICGNVINMNMPYKHDMNCIVCYNCKDDLIPQIIKHITKNDLIVDQEAFKNFIEKKHRVIKSTDDKLIKVVAILNSETAYLNSTIKANDLKFLLYELFCILDDYKETYNVLYYVGGIKEIEYYNGIDNLVDSTIII